MRVSCDRFRVKRLSLLVAATLLFFIIRHVFVHPYLEEKKEQRSETRTPDFCVLTAGRSEIRSAVSSTGKSEDPEDPSMKKEAGGGQSSWGGRGPLIWPNGTRLVDKVREMFRQNGVVLFTLINDAYLEMAASWCCNTRSFPQLHRRVVFLTTDLPTAQRLRAFCPGDVTVAVASGPQFSGGLNFSRVGYVRLMVDRARLVLRLLEAGVQLLQFEVDFVWFKDPVPVVLSRQDGADIVVTKSESEASKKACGCFLLLNPTPATLSFWRRFVKIMDKLYQKIHTREKAEAVPGGCNTQSFIQWLIDQNYAGVRIDYLPYEDFPDGKWYTRSRQQALQQPYFIHNNWIVGEPAKRLRAKAYGHWFWDSSTNRCNSSALRRWKL